MIRRLAASWTIACLMVTGCQPVRPAVPAAVLATTEPAAERTDRPVARTDARFRKMHAEILARRSPKIRLLLLGASVIERWQTTGSEQYKTHFARYDPDDFGVSGDKTQHILWRINDGELDGMNPRVVLIHTGNNNIVDDSVDDVVRGIAAVVDAVHTRLPHSKVLLMALFPRGADPEDPKVAALRAKIKRVNADLVKLDDGERTRVLDIGDKYLDADGVIRFALMNDAQHPTAKAYEIWATAVEPTLEKMMADPTTGP